MVNPLKPGDMPYLLAISYVCSMLLAIIVSFYYYLFMSHLILPKNLRDSQWIALFLNYMYFDSEKAKLSTGTPGTPRWQQRWVISLLRMGVGQERAFVESLDDGGLPSRSVYWDSLLPCLCNSPSDFIWTQTVVWQSSSVTQLWCVFVKDFHFP